MERLETKHRCCSKQKVKRGLWSPEEDEKLVNFITSHGLSSWSSVPKLAGLQRCGKSCRLRWINYLRPDLKKGAFTEEEERTIIEVHRIIGNRWAQIAKHLPGRTDNEVKNLWNSSIKKKLLSQGLDPTTHNLLPKKIPVDDGYSSFGWNLLEIDPCFQAPDSNGFVPVDGNSIGQNDDRRQGERAAMAVQMDGQMGFGQGDSSSIGYGYSMDNFGFGDYAAMLQSSGVFGDDIASSNGDDQLARSSMNNILVSTNSSSLYP